MKWVRHIPNAPERSWHASGPIFSPNRRFWTQFGPFLMFWARLENQVWTKLGPEPPARPADSGTFFLGPMPELFFCKLFVAFPGISKINVDPADPTFLFVLSFFLYFVLSFFRSFFLYLFIFFLEVMKSCQLKPRIGIPGEAKSGFKPT